MTDNETDGATENATKTQSIQLPVELHEVILNHLQTDLETLRCAALVNSQWRSASQKLLFQKIRVCFDNESLGNSPPWLLSILRRGGSPLPGYINHLQIELASMHKRGVEEVSHFIHILPIVLRYSKISSLTLFSWERWRWNHQWPSLRKVLKQFLTMNSKLCSIHILEGMIPNSILVDNPPRPDPLEFKELELIRSGIFVEIEVPPVLNPDGKAAYLHGERFYHEDGFRLMDPSRGSPPRVRVDCLTLLDAQFQPPSPNVLFEAIDISRVKHLRINRPASSFAAQALAACHCSLQHLTIYDDYPSDPSGIDRDTGKETSEATTAPSPAFIDFDFSECLRLTSMRIFVILLPYEPNYSMPESLDILTRMSFPPQLCSISIVLMTDEESDKVGECIKANLTPLDQALSANLDGQGKTIKALEVQLVRIPVENHNDKGPEFVPHTAMPCMTKKGVLRLKETRGGVNFDSFPGGC